MVMLSVGNYFLAAETDTDFWETLVFGNPWVSSGSGTLLFLLAVVYQHEQPKSDVWWDNNG
jgi:hypothetical protein